MAIRAIQRLSSSRFVARLLETERRPKPRAPESFVIFL
jgi:hypothetical protein